MGTSGNTLCFVNNRKSAVKVVKYFDENFGNVLDSASHHLNSVKVVKYFDGNFGNIRIQQDARERLCRVRYGLLKA